MTYYADKDAAIADSLIHYWSFDEDSGAIAGDLISGMDAVISHSSGGDIEESNVVTPTGRGRDLYFGDTHTETDTKSINIDPSAFSSAIILNAWSIRVRFLFRSMHQFDQECTLFHAGSGANVATIRIYGSTLYLKTTTNKITAPSPLPTDVWVDVVATYDGADLKLYQDDTLLGTAAWGLGLQLYYKGVSDDIHIASRWPSSIGVGYQMILDGVIDEVSIWDKTLSSTEVSALYNGGSPEGLTPPPIPPTPLIEPFNGVVNYKARLTGAPDALPDLDLRISSFNARIRSARDSYLSVVVPNARDLAADIEARPNGVLELYQSVNGTDSWLVAANLKSISIDEGSSSGYTVSLSGNKQKTYATPDRHSITSQSYYARTGGKSRIRAPIMYGVEPADTIQSNGIEFVVDTVTLIGNSSRAYMEVSE